ncbi:hypothetical protein QZH41_006577 [Actinostola sp. cb2023]|nr:hypothetical protein QZH41_006577 [Actinostola sp. cb2023]
MDKEDNIFLRAAMSKTVVEVPHSPEPSENKYMGPSTSGKKNVSTPKLSCHGTTKSLEKNFGEYYRKASEDGMGGSTTNRKAAIERVRKLSQKTLDKTSTFRRSSESSTSKTRADEEFVPSFKEDDADWDTCEDEGSWEEAAQTIAKKDKRYLGIQQQRSREGIMVGLNDTDNEDQEQDRSCGKKKKSARSDKSNKKKKLDEVLEAMPEMIRLASTAAKDHSHHSSEFRLTFMATSTLNFIFAITATISNAFVVIGMAKDLPLRKPSNALLFCLAISDLAVGLICQPLYICWKIDWIVHGMSSRYWLFNSAFGILSGFFAAVSFLTMTEISCERYLALHYHLRYESIVTVPKLLAATLFPWLFVGLLLVLNLVYDKVLIYALSCIMPLCFVLNLICYVHLFSILRRHHNQISTQMEAIRQQDQVPNQGETADLLRYRKSVYNMLILCLILLFCYGPYCLIAVLGRKKLNLYVVIGRNLSLTLVFMNSSVNPMLFCYRITPIRVAVKNLLRRCCCCCDSGN